MCAARVLLAPGWNAAAGQSGTRVCPLHANEWHGGDPALIQATLTLTLSLSLSLSLTLTLTLTLTSPNPALIQAGKIRPPRYVLHHGTASWASLQSKSQELCRLLRACPR